MSRVLLATSAELPDGEPRGGLLVSELAARGVAAAWAVWDDPGVDWAAADLVLVRSTWDYDVRRAEFLAWARAVASRTRLANPPEALAWNTDKAYLLDLVEAGLSVVPTLSVDSRDALPEAVGAFGRAVVKPRVGAGGRGVVVVDGPGDLDRVDPLPAGPWVVQPLVESVRTEGETSVFVLGGEATSQVSKRPGAGEIRVHEEYGGRTDPVPLAEEAAGLARRTVAVAQRLLGADLPYARGDLMRAEDGALVVSELEVTEPGLYLDVLPGNAAAFAEAVAGLTARLDPV